MPATQVSSIPHSADVGAVEKQVAVVQQSDASGIVFIVGIVAKGQIIEADAVGKGAGRDGIAYQTPVVQTSGDVISVNGIIGGEIDS